MVVRFLVDEASAWAERSTLGGASSATARSGDGGGPGGGPGPGGGRVGADKAGPGRIRGAPAGRGVGHLRTRGSPAVPGTRGSAPGLRAGGPRLRDGQPDGGAALRDPRTGGYHAAVGAGADGSRGADRRRPAATGQAGGGAGHAV
ncbi:MAG: hypothetical protein C4303_09595, partial [candidate division GAL15 bacterium]